MHTFFYVRDAGPFSFSNFLLSMRNYEDLYHNGIGEEQNKLYFRLGFCFYKLLENFNSKLVRFSVKAYFYLLLALKVNLL